MTEVLMPNDWIPRPYQIPAWKALDQGCKRVLMLHHRKAGKDTVALNWVATQMALAPTSCLYLFPEFGQAKRTVFRELNDVGQTYLDQAFPEAIRGGNKPNTQDAFLRLYNNSIFQLGGFDNIDRYIGSNPKIVVMSEFAASPHGERAWQLMIPVLRRNNGVAIFPYTPRGKNHGKHLFDMGSDNPSWFVNKLTVDDTNLEVDVEDQRMTLAQAVLRDVARGEIDEAFARQEFWCFPPEAPILTARGLVPIVEMRVGDMVLTHCNRWRPVDAVMSKPHDGELVSIASYGGVEPILCTPEHPIRVCDPATQSYRWVPAGEIKHGDRVTFPRLALGQPLIPEALARLIGWYVAEGSVSKNHVQFTLHAGETAYHAEIEQAARDMGFEAWTNLTSAAEANVANMGINSCQLADFLVTHCGSGARNKRLPLQLIAGHERVVFDALMAGDGCALSDGNRRYAYTTVSRSLAYEVQVLAHSLGYGAGIAYRPPSISMIGAREIRGGPSWNVQIADGLGCKIRSAKNSVTSFVRAVERVPFAGQVFNLKVKQDESYTAYGRVVHNCSFEAPNTGSYYGRLLEQAEDQGRVTHVPWNPALPVYTWWDIGVFDATVIWFVQRERGGALRLIDYYEADGEGLAHYLQVLNDRREMGWTFEPRGQLVPHDFGDRDFQSGDTPEKAARSLGWRMTVVPRPTSVQAGIDSVRRVLPLCWFDKEKAGPGFERLKAYTKRWSPQLERFMGPEHDANSHAADAVRTGVSGMVLAGMHLAPNMAQARQQGAIAMNRGAVPVVAVTDFNVWSR